MPEKPPRLRKLTQKTKYRIMPDCGAEIWARHLPTGEWRKLGTCHESTVYAVLDGRLELRAVLDQGLVRMAPQH